MTNVTGSVAPSRSRVSLSFLAEGAGDQVLEPSILLSQLLQLPELADIEPRGRSFDSLIMPPLRGRRRSQCAGGGCPGGQQDDYCYLDHYHR